MFTRDELAARLPGLGAETVPPIEWVEYPAVPAGAPPRDSYVLFHLGRRADFGDALSLWLHSLLQSHDGHGDPKFGEFAAAAAFRPLAMPEWVRLTPAAARVPDPLPDPAGFVAALFMYGPTYRGREVEAAVAEYSDRYVAFYRSPAGWE